MSNLMEKNITILRTYEFLLSRFAVQSPRITTGSRSRRGADFLIIKTHRPLLYTHNNTYIHVIYFFIVVFIDRV